MRNLGMTIIELVLVMMIIGVLAVVVTPKMNDFYVVELRSAVKLLASDIKYAQSQAIAERRRYGVRFNLARNEYVVFRRAATASALPDTDDDQDILLAASHLAFRERVGFVVPAGSSPPPPAPDFWKIGDSMVRKLERVQILSASFDGALTFEFDSFGTPYRNRVVELINPGRVVLTLDGVVDTLTIYPLAGKVTF